MRNSMKNLPVFANEGHGCSFKEQHACCTGVLCDCRPSRICYVVLTAWNLSQIMSRYLFLSLSVCLLLFHCQRNGFYPSCETRHRWIIKMFAVCFAPQADVRCVRRIWMSVRWFRTLNKRPATLCTCDAVNMCVSYANKQYGSPEKSLLHFLNEYLTMNEAMNITPNINIIDEIVIVCLCAFCVFVSKGTLQTISCLPAYLFDAAIRRNSSEKCFEGFVCMIF